MKNSLTGLLLLVLAGPVFAAKNEITIPALTPLPFVLGSTGGVVSANVENWGSLGDVTEGIGKVGSHAADQLQASKCTLTLAVHRDADGRLQSQDGLASISCAQSLGSIVALDVPGVIVDSKGMQGLQKGEVGEKAFFIVQSTLSIPSESM